MLEEKEKATSHVIERYFEQPSDAISFYSDLAQVFSTENEIVMQFYESIPGTPDSSGQIKKTKTRLRATITLSQGHAKNLGSLVLEHIKEKK